MAATQALSVLQELEDKKLKQLRESTFDNTLRLLDIEKPKNVDDYLWDYVCDERRTTMAAALGWEE